MLGKYCMEDIKEGNISGLTVEKADGQEPVAEKADAKEPAAEKENVQETAAEKADTLEPYVDRAAFDMVKKKKHIFRNAVVIVAAVLLLGYGVMTFLAYRYFPMGIRINGKDYSFRSYEDTLKELDAPYQDYELKLHFRNGDVTLSSEDMGFKATVEEDLKALRDDINPFFWFGYLWTREKTVDVVISYDKDKLKASLEECSQMKPENMKEPENPTLIFNERTNRVEAVPGDKGTKLDTEMVYDIACEKAAAMEGYFDVKNSECYVEPEYTVDSGTVSFAVEKANSYIDTKIGIMYADHTIYVEPKDIYKMLQIYDDYDVQVIRRNVEKYVIEFSRKYDTFDKYRDFRTHDGKIYKAKGEEYGFKLDIEKETELLYIDVVHRIDVERKPEFIHKAYAYDKYGNDIGGNYAEVDLTNQKVYLYLDGELAMECDCVSGNMAEDHGTPGGLFKIDGMAYDVVLRGDDYASPVLYWMPFNGGIGFHDATWRTYFGGDIYKKNGSHGCINMPLENARFLFEKVERGFPVICYWEEDLLK